MKIDCSKYDLSTGRPAACRDKNCLTCSDNKTKTAVPYQDIRVPVDAWETRERIDRGISRDYKLLDDAYEILFKPEAVIKHFKAKIKKRELLSLLKSAVAVWNEGGSIDQLIHSAGYGKEIRQLVAHCIITLDEIRILFRGKWYSNYENKIREVSRYPETGIYHEQAIKISTRFFPKSANRQTTLRQIRKDAFKFLRYLRGRQILRTREGAFYETKAFRCILMLVGHVRSVLGDELKGREPNAFSRIVSVVKPGGRDISVDQCLHSNQWHPKGDNPGVLFASLPAITLKATMEQKLPE